MVLIYLLIAVIGAGVAVFALQNLGPVVIRFLGWRVEGTPLAMVILFSIVAGVLVSALIGLVQQLRLRARIRQLENRLAHVSAGAEKPTDARPPR